MSLTYQTILNFPNQSSTEKKLYLEDAWVVPRLTAFMEKNAELLKTVDDSMKNAINHCDFIISAKWAWWW